jgi:hypothetical protein
MGRRLGAPFVPARSGPLLVQSDRVRAGLYAGSSCCSARANDRAADCVGYPALPRKFSCSDSAFGVRPSFPLRRSHTFLLGSARELSLAPHRIHCGATSHCFTCSQLRGAVPYLDCGAPPPPPRAPYADAPPYADSPPYAAPPSCADARLILPPRPVLTLTPHPTLTPTLC